MQLDAEQLEAGNTQRGTENLLLLALAPAAGFLLQGLAAGRGLLCCGITLGLVCVYVLVLQTKFTVDTLTGVSNRIVALRYLESELPTTAVTPTARCISS